MTPILNWLELEILVRDIASRTDGMFVERVVVPERREMAAGYVKSEWALRLTSRKTEATLIFSARPRHPYIALVVDRLLKLAPGATRSPFDLALSKHLKGARLLEIATLPRERVVTIWFSDPDTGSNSDSTDGAVKSRLGLVLFLIAATPEAFLVRPTEPKRWEILARSRTLRAEPGESAGWYIPPDGHNAPEAPPVREEFARDAAALAQHLENELRAEAFELRLQAAQRALKDLLKQARARAKQSGTAAREAEKEADWGRYGTLLKSVLGTPPPLVDGFREVVDYATDQMVRVPGDISFTPSAQVEKYFSLARRKQRRIEEARSRQQTFDEAIARFEKILDPPPVFPDFAALERLEQTAGTTVEKPSTDARRAKPAKKARHAWLGRSFRSKEGLMILVGRKKEENLELTFKHARGNDLWLHVRGKPGAHALIPIPAGRTASLDTLLDAANLTLFYSGGEKWGKTEVDYTYKKYVKRIKDSTEVSYTNNKTLIVQPDPERLKRLLAVVDESKR